MKRILLFFAMASLFAYMSLAQERVAKIYHFLSVDPKADQYPGVNPYLYCAGNPIKYIDPTGMIVNSSFKKTKDGNYEAKGDNIIATAVETAFKKFPNNTVICAHGYSNGIHWWFDKENEVSNDVWITDTYLFKSYTLEYDQDNSLLQEIGDNKYSIVILMSCETGKGEDNIAQKISAEMPNTLVVAPSGLVLVQQNGEIEVVTKECDKNGKSVTKPGLWKIYFNGKERTNFTGLPVFKDKTVENYIEKFKQEDEIK